MRSPFLLHGPLHGLPPFTQYVHFFLTPTCTSEGVIAYYWSQFDIPVEDLSVVPQFSEERVLETLENGLKMQRSMAGTGSIQIREVTASCKYHPGQGGGVTTRGQKMRTTSR